MKDNNKRRKPPKYIEDEPNNSLRLTFRYDGEQNIKLIKAREIPMLAPPSDKLGRLDPCSGFCCELRTARNRVLYRRFGVNPIQTSVEVLGGTKEKPFARHTVKKPSGEFDILVPILDKAAKIAFLSDSHLREAGPMETIAEFSLSDLPDKYKK